MDDVEEILDRLDRETVEEKHRQIDEKLDEVHEQIALLDQHINNKR
ncbi:hypothetical protein [Candidatus Nanohalococcus occultus]